MSGVFPERFTPGFRLAPPAAIGPTSTMAENWSAAVEEQRRLYNFGALPRAMGEQYDRLLSALQPDGAAGVDAAGMRETFVNPFADSPFEYRPWGAMQRRNRSAEDLADAFWQRFEALPEERKAQLGDVPKSRAELEAAVRSELQAVRARTQDVSERAGVMGTVAGMGGSMAGSLSDPVTLGSLAFGAGPMGPGAAGFARFVVGEALVNAAAETATLPGQARVRDFIGDPLRSEEAIAQVLMAAGLGAGFAGAVGGVARGVPKAAELIRGASDADLAAAFRRIVKRPGPTGDAAAQTLERAAEEVRTVPAEISPATVRQHEERTAEAEAAVLAPVAPVVAPPAERPAPAVAVAQAAADRAGQGRRLSAADYDRLVRTVAGEAESEGQAGMKAVAHVVLNRLATGRWGDSVESVVTARRQFEPWERADRRAWMEGLTPDSPAWRAAAAAVDDVLAGRAPDPTGGALNFLNPAIVEQRRGRRPEELDRPGRQIGRHWFWNAPGGEAPARVFRAPVERFDPRSILTDAEAYQFKAGGDAAGVTDRLMGVAQWDDLKAGTLILHERLDGMLYVADGHQRLGLAQRLAASGQDVQVDARVLRESEGVSIEDARAFAAAKNIAEGTGTAIDAAKVLRSRPDLFATLPPRSRLVRLANDLGRLGDEPFGMVVNELVDPAHAAIVAARVADEAAQAGVLRLLAKARPETEREARALVDEAIAAGFGRETQTSLFGDAEIADSYVVERAKIRSAAVRRLSRDRRVFETLTAEADRIRDAGNVLQEGENARRARLAGQAEEILDRLANRKGPVGDALAAAAARARADGRIGPAVDDFVAVLRGALDGDDRAGLPGGGGGGARPAAAEDGAVSAEPAPERPDDAVTALPDDATLSLFDQPAGPGQAAQAAELEADVARTFATRPLGEKTAPPPGDNLRRAREAIGRLMADRTGRVEDALVRDDLGPITLDWGSEGQGERGRGGSGIAHILHRRGSEGGDAEAFVRERLPQVLANGRLSRIYGPPRGRRADVVLGSDMATLSLYRSAARETWLLTGFERLDGGEGGSGGQRGFVPRDDLRDAPSRYSDAQGAEPSQDIVPPTDAGNAERPPAIERTDQGDQLVMPGAEVTDADRVAARGRRGLTPERAQKPADEGLFDVAGRGQTDLLETADLARQAQAENAADQDFLAQLDLVCGVAGKGTQ